MIFRRVYSDRMLYSSMDIIVTCIYKSLLNRWSDWRTCDWQVVNLLPRWRWLPLTTSELFVTCQIKASEIHRYRIAGSESKIFHADEATSYKATYSSPVAKIKAWSENRVMKRRYIQAHPWYETPRSRLIRILAFFYPTWTVRRNLTEVDSNFGGILRFIFSEG